MQTAAAMDLRIQTRRIEPDIVVVEFAGGFTLTAAEGHVEARLNELLREHNGKLIFDLTGRSEERRVGKECRL